MGHHACYHYRMGRPKIYLTPEALAEAKKRWAAKTRARPETKERRRRRERSPKVRAQRAAYGATPAAQALAKARYARYRQTDGYRQAQERYRVSMNGKATISRYAKWAKSTQPECIKARAAIAVAMRAGMLTRPTSCPQCQRVVRPDAHHHLGYEPQHWFDVEWLCRRCHKQRHLA